MARKVKTKVGFAGHVADLEVTLPDGEPPPWGADAALRVVGTDVPRVDGPDKVTGRARYTFDIALPGMLHAKILHAPWGAALLKAVDVSAARKMPGVRGVHVFKEAGRRISYHGDEIVAVAADSEEEAEDALGAVRVSYDKGPVATTLEGAMRAGAPRVFPEESNVKTGAVEGNAAAVAEALKGAAKVVEAVFDTQVQTHTSLEPHGAVAAFAADGSLQVWCSTQATFAVKGGAVQASGLPDDKVHVIAEHVGGGFGSKFSLSPSGLAAIALAKQTGKPVKCMLTREGDHTTGGNRPSSLQRMKGGIDKNGKIVALSVETFGSAGVAGEGAGCANPVIYLCGEKQKSESHVLTNGGPSAPFRAPGHPQGLFALESFMDLLAEAARLDPLEFRKRHIDEPVYLAQWDLGAAKIGWSRRNKTPGAGRGARRRGIGMASSLWYTMGRPGFEVGLSVRRDGRVEVWNGAQDIGTGTRTVLAVVVAEELGLRPGDVTVHLGDTRWPKGPGSGGSVTAATLGPAARTAAWQAREKLAALAAGALGVPAADLRFEAGRVAGRGKSLSFAEAARLATADIDVVGHRAQNYEAFKKRVHGCQFAEVEVDVETGQVRVVKIVAVQDAGRVVDKLTFESQIIGGVIQGLSYALFEERVLDRRHGTQMNADMLTYKIAGSADMPEIVPVAFEVANAGNNVGMMGLGEPPTVPTAGAIANAVYNAIGVQVRSLPITPDRVLAALSSTGGGR